MLGAAQLSSYDVDCLVCVFLSRLLLLQVQYQRSSPQFNSLNSLCDPKQAIYIEAWSTGPGPKCEWSKPTRDLNNQRLLKISKNRAECCCVVDRHAQEFKAACKDSFARRKQPQHQNEEK